MVRNTTLSLFSLESPRSVGEPIFPTTGFIEMVREYRRISR